MSGVQMTGHVFCGRGSVGHRPPARSCICRVAQPGGAFSSPERSSNGAPVPAAVGVGQPVPAVSQGAALQEEITDSFDTSSFDPSGSSMGDSGVACSQLKLKILNSVAGIHPSYSVASTSAGNT